MICCRYLDDGIAQHFAAAALGYACQGDNCVCVFWLFIIRTPPKCIFDCLAYFNAKSATAKKCRSRERTTLPVIFLFFFFHFSKMRSWGLSFGSRGGMRELHDRPCRWMEFHTNTPRLVFFFKRLLDVFIFGISSLRYKYDNFLNNCWFSLDSVSTLLAVPRRFLHPDSLKITKTVACSTGNRPNGKPKVFYFVLFFLLKFSFVWKDFWVTFGRRSENLNSAVHRKEIKDVPLFCLNCCCLPY